MSNRIDRVIAFMEACRDHDIDLKVALELATIAFTKREEGDE